MNRKQYITPQITMLTLETVNIIASSLKEDGTTGNIGDAKPSTGGSTSKHIAERNYFDSWTDEDETDGYDY